MPILVKGKQEAKIRIAFQKKGDKTTQFSEWQKLQQEDDYSATIWLEGIQPKTAYRYRVEFEKESSTEWIGLKEFPEEGKSAKFSFVFSSCFQERYKPHFVFDAIQKESPTFVALIGDNIYADYDGDLNKRGERQGPVLEAFRGKYDRNLDEHFQKLFQEIPLVTIWDDHDYGINNGDRGYRFKEVSKKVFQETFPDYPFVEPDGGLYYRFEVADVDFFILDTRWYRSSIHKKDGPRKTMLGEKQLRWLLEGLKESQGRGAPLKVIFSGVSWNEFGGDRPQKRPKAVDNWTGYPREREEILDFIKKERIEGVLVLSGDQHWPAVYRIEDEPAIFEVSASPLNTERPPRPPFAMPNPIQKRSVEIFKPSWWAHSSTTVPPLLKPLVSSVYGLVEVDTVEKSVYVTLKEMNRTTHQSVPLFRLEMRL